MAGLRVLNRLMVLTVATVSPGVAVGQEVGVTPETMAVRVPGTALEFELVRCPGGEFVSDEGKTVEVGALWVLRTEVTWDLYDVFVFALDEAEGEGVDGVSRPSKPYVPPDRGYGHAGYPAIGMTRAGAEAFCAWLEARTGLEARLPTRAEWAHLARGGAVEPNGLPAVAALEDFAWFEANTDNATEPVGQKRPNGFGLHDMLGNVAEWVTTETRRPVAMGGSFREEAGACTPVSSQTQASSWNMSDPQIPKSAWWLADCGWVGFRFVIDASEDEGASDEE
ncbi:MAG: formylglycine-generating enzyme family protein [Phycisphaerales bacterium JB059]